MVFPKWLDAWHSAGNNKDGNEKYKYIDMGFGNSLCVDRRIYDEYEPYLKKYVKFRKEDGYILLCDCSIIQNYELSMETYEILLNLKYGYNPIQNEIENDLIDDLENLELIADYPNSNEGFHNKKWISLGYDEGEIFQ